MLDLDVKFVPWMGVTKTTKASPNPNIFLPKISNKPKTTTKQNVDPLLWVNVLNLLQALGPRIRRGDDRFNGDWGTIEIPPDITFDPGMRFGPGLGGSGGKPFSGYEFDRFGDWLRGEMEDLLDGVSGSDLLGGIADAFSALGFLGIIPQAGLIAGFLGLLAAIVELEGEEDGDGDSGGGSSGSGGDDDGKSLIEKLLDWLSGGDDDDDDDDDEDEDDDDDDGGGESEQPPGITPEDITGSLRARLEALHNPSGPFNPSDVAALMLMALLLRGR